MATKTANPFICCICHEPAGVGYIINHKTYCGKDGDVELGRRDKTGKAIPQPEPVESLPIEPGDNSDVVNEQMVVVTKRRKYVRRKQG